MKFTNNKKIALATLATTMMSTVVNATAGEADIATQNIGNWVTIIAEILSVLCLLVFTIYLARFLSIKNNGEEKVVVGVRNGVITGLVGMAVCQAVIIVSQLCF